MQPVGTGMLMEMSADEDTSINFVGRGGLRARRHRKRDAVAESGVRGVGSVGCNAEGT